MALMEETLREARTLTLRAVIDTVRNKKAVIIDGVQYPITDITIDAREDDLEDLLHRAWEPRSSRPQFVATIKLALGEHPERGEAYEVVAQKAETLLVDPEAVRRLHERMAQLPIDEQVGAHKALRLLGLPTPDGKA